MEPLSGLISAGACPPHRFLKAVAGRRVGRANVGDPVIAVSGISFAQDGGRADCYGVHSKGPYLVEVGAPLQALARVAPDGQGRAAPDNTGAFVVLEVYAVGDVAEVYPIKARIAGGGGGGGGFTRDQINAFADARALRRYTAAEKAKLAGLTSYTEAEINALADARALMRFTAAEKEKLRLIEAAATGDQTALEIIALLNAQLGGATWQQGGGGGGGGGVGGGETRTTLVNGTFNIVAAGTILTGENGFQVVSPETGEIEVAIYAKGGNRADSVSFWRGPAAWVRETAADGCMLVSLGANRYIGLCVDSNGFGFLLQAQQADAAGNHRVMLHHIT